MRVFSVHIVNINIHACCLIERATSRNLWEQKTKYQLEVNPRVDIVIDGPVVFDAFCRMTNETLVKKQTFTVIFEAFRTRTY